jgi:Fe-S-cluster containining protein
LLQGDDERRRFASWSITLPIRDSDGRLNHERVIAYRDDRCPFLDEASDRCLIYEDRPQSCRNFECTRYFNQWGVGRHGRFVAGNDIVRQMLELW